MKGKFGKKVRRRSALSILETQLKSGVKPNQVDGKTDSNNLISFTKKDNKRIAEEIENLKNKLK